MLNKQSSGLRAALMMKNKINCCTCIAESYYQLKT